MLSMMMMMMMMIMMMMWNYNISSTSLNIDAAEIMTTDNYFNRSGYYTICLKVSSI